MKKEELSCLPFGETGEGDEGKMKRELASISIQDDSISIFWTRNTNISCKEEERDFMIKGDGKALAPIHDQDENQNAESGRGGVRTTTLPYCKSLSCSASVSHLESSDSDSALSIESENVGATEADAIGEKGAWQKMPDTVMSEILKYASIHSTRVMRSTCKDWNQSIGRLMVYLQPDDVRNSHENFPQVMALDLSSANLKMHNKTNTMLDLVPSVEDDDLMHVQKFSRLESLYLNGCLFVQGHGLQHLGNLESLVFLDISGCNGMDDQGLIMGMKHVSKLESLVMLGCSELTDSAVAYASQCLPRLKRLAVPPRTSDLGLNFVSTAKKIERVAIRGCNRVSPFGIKELLKAKNLKRVVICKCKHVSAKTLQDVTNRLSIMKCNSFPCCILKRGKSRNK
eukprot:jgi/Picsp_1/5707/NSC_03066-R1_f-box lrr-repeat protein 16-like